MPYEIVRKGSEFCVVKQGTDKTFGCHPTEEKAKRQMAALYANEPGKAFSELKTEDLSGKQPDHWLAGERGRRVLAVPFYGPIPFADGKGRDLDGEYFDNASDLYGPFPALRASRERMVDWHHDDHAVPDPRASRMKGAILGHIELDEEPDEDGYWGDWWARAGDANLALVKRQIMDKGRPLFASSQPVKGAVYIEDDGHIATWPLIRVAITTSPANRWATIPDLKAVLSGEVSYDDVGLAALRAALVGLDDLIPTLDDGLLNPDRAVPAKAGRVLSATNEASLRRAVDELSTVLAKLLKDEQIEAALAAEGNG